MFDISLLPQLNFLITQQIVITSSFVDEDIAYEGIRNVSVIREVVKAVNIPSLGGPKPVLLPAVFP